MKRFLTFLVFLCVCYCTFWVIHNRVVVVSGSSMEPAYSDGDILLVRPIHSVAALSMGNPVCCLTSPDGDVVIKRLIGYPGDTVELIDGGTYVNGDLLMERTSESWDNMVFKCGPDQYLFLGDNRADSNDARFWSTPFVSSSDIISEVLSSQLEVG